MNDAIVKKSLNKSSFEWSLKKLSIILQPFVPHISEELWSNLGGVGLCIDEIWNKEEINKKVTLKIALQINGKTKDVIEIEDNLTKEEVFEIVKSNNKIKNTLKGKSILKEVYVPGKIMNLVI